MPTNRPLCINDKCKRKATTYHVSKLSFLVERKSLSLSLSRISPNMADLPWCCSQTCRDKVLFPIIDSEYEDLKQFVLARHAVTLQRHLQGRTNSRVWAEAEKYVGLDKHDANYLEVLGRFKEDLQYPAGLGSSTPIVPELG